ncbi:hypothetical protein EWM64_g8821 [Hericium alpestre]|uniref:Cwf19-like C-terminal domain-containing protein n=1 Tax=Hericium alpestre TaxID=135208 RepID=A0A4Y9ZP29_9AGAM|nr:hypothetical protein EWM64_g8821 [Hericium alpestre]
MARSGAETPLARPQEGPSWQRYDSMHLPSEGGTPGSHFHTPVPSVAPAPTLAPPPTTGRTMSPSSLNKMQAKVLRAKLMNDPNAETLEAQYEAELSKAHEAQAGGGREQVNMMPVVDARGRLYDIGSENPLEQSSTLEEMLRQERVGGADTQKKLDNQFARSIMTDSGFEADLDYTDDNAEKLARQKMRSDAMKRQFAIQDYKRTQQALATCPFCYGEDDSLPKAPVIALGTRVYLSCTLQEELVPGHCLIVPIQHHLTMLEADDDVWDEVRNFMKSVMQMFADEDKGVIFYETILTLKSQKHTVIECVPVPWEEFDLLPGYFKESIMNSEAEWSQHKKLIDFSKRGGFRRMMVPNLPYFMVQFDHKGEKGYGHVIEGTSEAVDEDDPVDEGDKGGGDFPPFVLGTLNS